MLAQSGASSCTSAAGSNDQTISKLRQGCVLVRVILGFSRNPTCCRRLFLGAGPNVVFAMEDLINQSHGANVLHVQLEAGAPE